MGFLIMKLTVEDNKEIIDVKKGGATNISIVMKLVVNGSSFIELICLYNAHGDLVLEAKLCSK